MPDRNAELRAQVRRVEANVRRKMRRNERKGVDVEGSGFSPLRYRSTVNALNKRQLTTYLNQLNKFQSRKNQFVPDAHGYAIPVKEWRTYKRLERRYNEHVNDLYNSVKDIRLPNGQLIRERMAIITPDHPAMADQTVNALYKPTTRSNNHINGRRALERLTRMMEHRNSPEYFEEHRQGNRETLDKMFDSIGDDEMRERVHQLTDNQFDILWNYSTFVTDLVMQYDSAQKMLQDPDYRRSAAIEAIDAEALKQANKLLDWVKDVAD